MAKTIGTMAAYVTLNSSKFMSGMQAVFKSLVAFERKIVSVGASIAKMAFSPVGLIAGAAGLAGGAMLYRSIMTEFEQLEIAKKRFFSMAGEAGGNQIINAMRDIIAEGGPTIQELSEMAQKFLAIGFNAKQTTALLAGMAPMMDLLGDPEKAHKAIKKIGDLITEIKASGEVTQAQFNDLAQMGLPIYEALALVMSQTTGQTVTAAQAMEAMKNKTVSAADALNALANISKTDAAQSMIAAHEGTLTNMWENVVGEMKVLFQDLGGEISKALDLQGFFGGLADYIRNLRVNFDSLRPAIQSVGTVLATLRDILFAAFKVLTQFFTRMGEGSDDSVGRINSIRAAVVSMAWNFVNGLQTIARVMGAALQEALLLMGKIKQLTETPKSAGKDFITGMAKKPESAWGWLAAINPATFIMSRLGSGLSNVGASAENQPDISGARNQIDDLLNQLKTEIGNIGGTFAADFVETLVRDLKNKISFADTFGADMEFSGQFQEFFGMQADLLYEGQIGFQQFFNSINAGFSQSAAYLKREMELGNISAEQFAAAMQDAYDQAEKAVHQAFADGKITLAEYNAEIERLNRMLAQTQNQLEIVADFQGPKLPEWIEKLGEGESPLDVYRKKIDELQEALALDLISPEQFAAGAAMLVDELEKAVGAMDELKNPEALIAGSREAYSALLKIQNQGQGETAQQRIERLQARANEMQQAQLEYERQTAAAVMNMQPVAPAVF